MRTQVLGFLILSSCASYQKRKACEKENWYQHGYDVAMSGQRLNGDAHLLECRQVDAKIDEGQLDVGFKAGMDKYCLPEIVSATGKKGEFFSPDFCAPAQIPKLKALHEEGVRIFCKKANGFGAGASGYEYKQICPKDLEPAFLTQYKLGRKKFLSSRIEDKTKRKEEAKTEIDRLESSRHNLEMERAMLSGRRHLVRERYFDAAAGQYRETEHWETDPGVDSQIWSLDSEISSKNAEMRKLKTEIEEINKQVSKDKNELQSLDESNS